MKADIIVGLQYGDEGKGKVAAALAASGRYDAVLRWNGGPNAGHTVFLSGKKIVTHSLPVGVLYDIPSYIGRGCLVDPEGLVKEIRDVEEALGRSISHLVKIDPGVHIITEEHVREDRSGDKVGSTGRGIMPCLRDKYGRVGKFAVDAPALEPYICDSFLVDLMEASEVLCEGAQGVGLDIDAGDYPYISSNCLPGYVNSSGIPLSCIRDIIGVAKAYQTYVGAKEFQPACLLDADLRWAFDQIRLQGEEYGATTGRPRQIDWLDIGDLMAAAYLCGCTKVIINKSDVLQDLQELKPTFFNLYKKDGLYEAASLKDFQDEVTECLKLVVPEVIWSSTKEGI